MSLEENKAVARSFFEEFSKGNLQGVADLMAPDHVFHFPLFPEPQDKAQHVAGQQRIKGIFPDYRAEIVDQIAEGDMVMSRLIVRGTQQGEFLGQPGTGQTFEITTINIMRIRDGLIVDEWDELDTLSFLAQLGIVERP
jgi:steroid delta-isomerase-like uncharacterized protein